MFNKKKKSRELTVDRRTGFIGAPFVIDTITNTTSKVILNMELI